MNLMAVAVVAVHLQVVKVVLILVKFPVAILAVQIWHTRLHLVNRDVKELVYLLVKPVAMVVASMVADSVPVC